MENRSLNGKVNPNKAKVALKISPLIGTKIMVNSEEGVSVTTINSFKVVSTSDTPLLVVLYTGIGLVTINSNQKMKEIMTIMLDNTTMTLYSLISDVVYF